MRVIAYVRVSSIKQVQDGKDGIASQKYACEEYAKKNGIKIDKYYEDLGLSGALKIHRRPGLIAALGEIKKGDILLVYKKDRLARTRKILYEITEEVEKKKGTVISCLGEGTESKNKYDFTARMSEETAEFALSMERLLAEIRTKNRADEKKSKNERWGRIPYGFRLCDDGVHLEKCPDEQSIISLMHQLHEEGISVREGAKMLNQRNLLNRDNKPWTRSAFFRIMSRDRAAVRQRGNELF